MSQGDPQEIFGPDRLAQPAAVNSFPSGAWEGTVLMAAKRIQRRLAAILAADVVGSGVHPFLCHRISVKRRVGG